MRFGGRCLAWPLSRCARFARQEHGRFRKEFSRAANFPHGLTRRSSSSVGFSFRLALRRGYSGSADTLQEEAAKAAFSSPPRCRTFSPVAYRHGLPTVGRRRASPVMLQDHFLQAAACGTHVVPLRQSAGPKVERGIGALVSASSEGGDWRTTQAEDAVSRSHLAWPLRHVAFSGPPGGDALAAYLRG